MVNKLKKISEKIVSILMCKGDLSHEVAVDLEPCSTAELFRFASTRHKVFFTIGLLSTVLTGSLMPLNQILGGRLAEEYLEKPDATGDDETLAAVMVIVYIYAAATVVQFVFNFVQQYLLLTVTNEIVDKLRREYVAAVLRLDAESLDATTPGKLSSELNENIDKIRDGLGEKFALLIRYTCIFLFTLIAAFVYNWKVALILLPVGPLGAVVTALAGRFTARSVKQQMGKSAQDASLVEELVMNVKTVAACNGQEHMTKKYRSILDELVKLGSRICFWNGFFEGFLFFIIYFFAMLAILIGVPDTFSDSSSFDGGSVIIAFGSILQGAYCLGLLGPHMTTLLKARMAAAVIYRTIDKAAKLDSPSEAWGVEKVERLRGDIEFRNVQFKYASRDAMVLQGLTWSARAGQSIAFAGHSGCGKSTSIGLLTKLYEKCGGEIFVDGKAIEEYDRATIRKNIGMVSQEPCLFNGTIRENIMLGRRWNGKGTAEERMEQVARISQAATFIEKLEHGFDTLLGDGGISLSGGQKQRIAIARAIFTDPAILILDEATSALDAQSERLLQDALKDASAGRTTISIAHRLSTLKDVDVINVVDKGAVIERGTHNELLSRGGTYAMMAQRQNVGIDEKPCKEPDESTKELQRIRSRRNALTCDALPATGKDEQFNEEKLVAQPSFLRSATRGHLLKIFPAFLFSCLRGFEIPLYALLVNFIYDALGSTKDALWIPLAIACSTSLGIGCFIWTVNTLAYFFASKASESVIATVKGGILSRVLHKNAEFFDNTETSPATIVNDLNSQPSALLSGLNDRAVLFTWCITCIVTCNIIALIVCWPLGVISTVLTLIIALLESGLFLAFTALTEKHARICESPEIALEIFSHTRTVQIMAVEEYFQSRYTASQEQVTSINRKIVLVQSTLWSLSNGCIYLFGLVSYGIGAHLVYNGLLTGHQLYLIGMMIEFAAWELSFITPTFPDLVRANAAARILRTYFCLPEPRADSGDSSTQLSGSFAVRNVTFAYPARRTQRVAKKLNISASAGDSIALVGPSGCGKSTLISLIERFYDQQEGTIKLDDIDHRRFGLRHLRSQIALVGQEPILFQGSIAENILLGCSGCTLDDVREACRLANAARFIEDLPQGYETPVGSKGGSLSGGQRQRIAIARALVRKPKILLLDEATSALDGESERIVQEAIAKASEGRTSISIAHRLATIKNATRIYFIEDGSVVESGNHEDLIELNGKYASYVKAQSLESS